MTLPNLGVLLIDGKLVAASGGGTFETLNPATEEVLGVAADGTAADMDAAIEAARTAFDTTDLGSARPMGMPSHRWVLRDPAGVVGAITPWSFPHQISALRGLQAEWHRPRVRCAGLRGVPRDQDHRHPRVKEREPQ